LEKRHQKKALMIMNPLAGKMELFKKFGELTGLFYQNGYTLDIRCGAVRGDARTIVKKNSRSFDLVICCGGDGTLNEVINGMMECDKKIPIGYIPCGTTNDFAQSIGLPKTIMAAAKNIIKGTPVPIDIGSFGGRYFSYVASFGAFTQSSYTTPQNMKNVFGHFAYVLEGVKEIPYIKPSVLTITTETGETYTDEYALGAITNSTSIGGIIKLRDAQIDFSDGMFEILLIKFPKNIVDLNKAVMALNTYNYNDSSLSYFRAKEITISCDDKMMWSLDGEGVEADKTEIIKNHNKAVEIILA